jgi:hypothetical protein
MSLFRRLLGVDFGEKGSAHGPQGEPALPLLTLWRTSDAAAVAAIAAVAAEEGVTGLVGRAPSSRRRMVRRCSGSRLADKLAATRLPARWSTRR